MRNLFVDKKYANCDHSLFLFFVIFSPFNHEVLCLRPIMLLNCIHWTLGNKKSLFFGGRCTTLKHPDTLLVYASLLACLFDCLVIVPCWCDFNLKRFDRVQSWESKLSYIVWQDYKLVLRHWPIVVFVIIGEVARKPLRFTGFFFWSWPWKNGDCKMRNQHVKQAAA